MQVEESLKHTKWECKYHVVFIPKYRRKVLYQQVRRDLGEMFRELCRHSVSQVVGYVKGQSAIHLARTYEGRRRSFVG